MKEAQSLIDSYSRKHDDVWKSGHHQGSACIRYFDSISLAALLLERKQYSKKNISLVSDICLYPDSYSVP